MIWSAKFIYIKLGVLVMVVKNEAYQHGISLLLTNSDKLLHVQRSQDPSYDSYHPSDSGNLTEGVLTCEKI